MDAVKQSRGESIAGSVRPDDSLWGHFQRGSRDNVAAAGGGDAATGIMDRDEFKRALDEQGDCGPAGGAPAVSFTLALSAIWQPSP